MTNINFIVACHLYLDLHYDLHHINLSNSETLNMRANNHAQRIWLCKLRLLSSVIYQTFTRHLPVISLPFSSTLSPSLSSVNAFLWRAVFGYKKCAHFLEFKTVYSSSRGNTIAMDSSTGFWCFCFIATTFTISTVFSQGMSPFFCLTLSLKFQYSSFSWCNNGR